MAKVSDKRSPFDPAKAMRERNRLEAPPPPLTVAQRSVRKPGLRPLPAGKTDRSDAE